MTLQLNDFNYNLPEELIAQHPKDNRSDSRLLVVNRRTKKWEHKQFKDIIDYFTPQDMIIVNNTRVYPARLIGKKSTGGKVEVLLVSKLEKEKNQWNALLKGKLKDGDHIFFDQNLNLTIINKQQGIVEFSINNDELMVVLEKIGHIPLPPYIKRNYDPGQHELYHNQDQKRYQTIFAEQTGSVAAPTAGLHFDQQTTDIIRQNGTEIKDITLHVGLGTFLPVKHDEIDQHKMHAESYYISDEVKKDIAKVKSQNGRIFAIGTTSFRALESSCIYSNDDDSNCNTNSYTNSSPNNSNTINTGWHQTQLFIYPQHKNDQFSPQICGGLLTNFHQPKSTLFMLICALLTKDLAFEIYQDAIKNKYRFFSYGDAMLIL